MRATDRGGCTHPSPPPFPPAWLSNPRDFLIPRDAVSFLRSFFPFHRVLWVWVRRGPVQAARDPFRTARGKGLGCTGTGLHRCILLLWRPEPRPWPTSLSAGLCVSANTTRKWFPGFCKKDSVSVFRVSSLLFAFFSLILFCVGDILLRSTLLIPSPRSSSGSRRQTSFCCMSFFLMGRKIEPAMTFVWSCGGERFPGETNGVDKIDLPKHQVAMGIVPKWWPAWRIRDND